ncbi:hypothetical protein AVEN_238354-1 [Araneus ventricosus]|uniref:Uncharacterized protein n=1 Tax=Araneus ventricosus TaxID=182803 RepID=A0A4Y2V2H4_ARAVE|nr:hypothetical protein AVEN_238354-1 [Araneus ventricosus]
MERKKQVHLDERDLPTVAAATERRLICVFSRNGLSFRVNGDLRKIGWVGAKNCEMKSRRYLGGKADFNSLNSDRRPPNNTPFHQWRSVGAKRIILCSLVLERGGGVVTHGKVCQPLEPSWLELRLWLPHVPIGCKNIICCVVIAEGYSSKVTIQYIGHVESMEIFGYGSEPEKMVSSLDFKKDVMDESSGIYCCPLATDNRPA